jgi:hypothetical protein
VINKEAEKILKYKDLTTELAHVECKNICDTSNDMANCKYLKIIQKIPEQPT